MAAEPENSDNPPTTTPDNPPTTTPPPDAPPQEEEAAPEEAKRPRRRPKRSKDTKPRIRRVPVVIEQKEEEGAAATRGPKEPARPPDRKLAVSFAPEPERPAQPELPPPQKKSPRTLHREHVHAIAAERRKLAQARAGQAGALRGPL